MNREQKIAWVFVVTTGVATLLTVVMIAVLYAQFGMPRALLGLSTIGIAGLGGVAPLFVKKDCGKVVSDERDKLINRKAALAGFGSAYMFVGVVCMIPFFVFGPDAVVSVKLLPTIWIGAMVVHFFAQSVAILNQYGWTDKGQGAPDGCTSL